MAQVGGTQTQTRPKMVYTGAEAFSRESVIARLGVHGPLWRALTVSGRRWAWLGPLIVTLIGSLVRFYRLGEPPSLVFDETYYVKGGYSMLQSGYERAWAAESNDKFAQGDFSGLLAGPEYVVHPPVGKWLIGFGMWLFGPSNPFGWRFSTALVGTVAVLLLALIAQKLFRSTLLGTIAGLLLAIDGHAIVQSRTSLLDNFVMFFALLAFGVLLLDRDDGRRRLATRLARDTPALGSKERHNYLLYGPFLGVRWWRLAAGVALGLCTGTKWSGIFFIATYGLLTLWWDATARRQSGVRLWVTGAVLNDSPLAFLSIVGGAAGTYVASWTGWFLSSDAYNRQWALTNPAGAWDWVPAPLRSLWGYHLQMYQTSVGLTSSHPYQADAWSWFLMLRPTAYYARYTDGTCGGESRCAIVVNSLGNPLIWWAGAVAVLVLAVYGVCRRDWRALAILAGWGAGYLPWLLYSERTIFFFYAIAYEPYMILAIVFCLGLLRGRAEDPPPRHVQGIIFVGGFLVLVLLASAFFYPLWAGEELPYSQWRWRMWLGSWV